MNNKAVLIKLIDAFCDMYTTAEFSFAHNVLADYNLNDPDITYCLSQRAPWVADQIKDVMTQYDESERTFHFKTIANRAAVITAFLEMLLAIPEEVRMASMDRYDSVE